MNSSGIVALRKRCRPALSSIEDEHSPGVRPKAVLVNTRASISNMELEFDQSWSTDISSGCEDDDLESKIANCRFVLNPLYNDVYLVRRETAYSLREWFSKASL